MHNSLCFFLELKEERRERERENRQCMSLCHLPLPGFQTFRSSVQPPVDHRFIPSLSSASFGCDLSPENAVSPVSCGLSAPSASETPPLVSHSLIFTILSLPLYLSFSLCIRLPLSVSVSLSLYPSLSLSLCIRLSLSVSVPLYLPYSNLSVSLKKVFNKCLKYHSICMFFQW